MRVSVIPQVFFGYLLYAKHSSMKKAHSNEKRQKVLPRWSLRSSGNVPFKLPFGNSLHYITKRGWFKKSPEELIEFQEDAWGTHKTEKKFPFRENGYKLDLKKSIIWTGRAVRGQQGPRQENPPGGIHGQEG